jgi:hypothetical protein
MPTAENSSQKEKISGSSDHHDSSFCFRLRKRNPKKILHLIRKFREFCSKNEAVWSFRGIHKKFEKKIPLKKSP